MFIRFDTAHERDRQTDMQTDRHRMTAKTALDASIARQKCELSTNSWLSIDDCCSSNNNCDGGRCSLPHKAPHISESMFITTSMVELDHDEENRTKFNCTQP